MRKEAFPLRASRGNEPCCLALGSLFVFVVLLPSTCRSIPVDIACLSIYL